MTKKKRINKFITILAVIITLTSLTCVNAYATVLQDITSIGGVYPNLIMYISNSNITSLVEVSGIGAEVVNGGVYAQIYTDNGPISCQSESHYYGELSNQTQVILAKYTTQNAFTYLYNSKPININLWEWSQEYNDNIIWQLWDYSQINNLVARYDIEIPYFNNSLLLGTEPVEIIIEKEIQANIANEGIETYNYYNIEIPKIDEIIEKTIAAIESESQAGITFQYKGQELSNNNYVTNVYAEDGSKINIDFKKALSTIIVNTRMSFNSNAAEPGITQIGIVNYNDYYVNSSISHLRTNDFRKLVIEDEFQRSAEITMERQEKDVRILNWLGNAISGIMNVEIFPNFSLGGLLSVIVMIPIILWILKLVAGG